MSEYKRWISYVYSYENNVKKNNVGYIKIEKRSERTKVSIRINVLSVTEPMKVYLYIRENNTMKGTYIGDIVLDKNTMQPSYIYDEELNTNIINVSNTGGVIIYNSSEKFFGSEWDDVNINIDDLVIEEDIIHNAELPEENDVIRATSLDEDDSAQEVYCAENEKNECMDVITEAALTAEAVTDTDRAQEDTVPDDISDRYGAPAEDMSGTDVEQPHMMEATEAAVEELEAEGVSDEAGHMTDDKNEEYMLGTMTDKGSSGTDKRYGLRRTSDDDARKKIERAAQRMLATYPKMFPFEYDDMIKCVRIEPQDIGQLPIDTWALANNSFLLQGYYRYRHLMLISTGEEHNPAYLIGVPGVYRSRDEYMAGMFGFGLFKPMNNTGNMRGEFGYWCISITNNYDSRKYI